MPFRLMRRCTATKIMIARTPVSHEESFCVSLICSPYTFSRSGSPMIPVGRTRNTMIKIMKAMPSRRRDP